MNQLLDGPNTYDYGLAFNYDVWNANTNIMLCNVPWNNDYRDIVQFPTPGGTTLDTYLETGATPITQITGSKYAAANKPVMLEIPYNKAIGYNYLKAYNPAQPTGAGDAGKAFYYFILDVNYIAPDTTEFIVQLDVWQTYGKNIEFGNCYIERGHLGLANENMFRNYGRDFLTQPEGLDTGSDLRVADFRTHQVMSPVGSDGFHVLVCSTIDLLDDNTDSDGNPEIVSASGGQFNGLPSGASYYVFRNNGSFQTWLATIKNKPWIAQGITSITLIPSIFNYYPSFSFNSSGPTIAPTVIPQNATHVMFTAWRSAMLEHLPEEYRHLWKFLTSPYMVVEMTTWSATPIIIKPELWHDDNAVITERASLVPPDQRVQFLPYQYNTVTGSGIGPNADDGGEWLDFATMIQNFPTVAIVNNMSAMYMAANRNSIAFQQGSADWSQQRAMAAAATGYDQATSGMDLAQKLGYNSQALDYASTQIGNQNLMQQQILNSVAGVAGGGVHGSLGGGAGVAAGVGAGMVQGIAGNVAGMMQVDANNQQQAARLAASQGNVQAGQQNSGFVRDTNRNLAEFAAKGDYANSIAGINAKVQDSKFVQPTVSGQVGGDMANLIHTDTEVSLRFRMIDPGHVRTIGDYWLRYGYAVNRFYKVTDLKVMDHFSYWKMKETYIISTGVPEGMKQALRGIFEKGVTVWAYPGHIGTLAISNNTPLEGFAL